MASVALLCCFQDVSEILSVHLMSMQQMNKGKSQSSEKNLSQDDMKVGELNTASSLEEYAKVNRDDDEDDDDEEDEGQVI